MRLLKLNLMVSRAYIWELVADALGNLRLLMGRTLLALSGIVIGTAAVIAMLHIGANARSEALRQFNALGPDIIYITLKSEAAGGLGIRPEALPSLTKQGLLSDAAPFIQSGTVLRVGGQSISANLVIAADGLYSLVGAEMASGRRTSDLDRNAAFAVLGATVAGQLAAAGQSIGIGEQLATEAQFLTLVGVLHSQTANQMLGLDFNRSVIVPLGAARRFLDDPQITSVAARLPSDADDTVTADAIRRWFLAHARGTAVEVQTARLLIEGIERQMRVYGMLLLSIGTISLAVGGIGVMNVMLMSVRERRPEIGLRRAIGARSLDIRAMFLVEALFLAVAGSSIGLLIGVVSAWIFAWAFGWQFDFVPAALPLALGMAGAVGLFFGIYPAARAARMDPIAALRSQ